MSIIDDACLHVKIGKNNYKIPLSEVLEAGQLTNWTPIPFARKGYVGAITIHDSVVALLDYEEGTAVERPFVVYLKNHGIMFGLLVDSIGAITGLKRTEPPPELKQLFNQLEQLLQFSPKSEDEEDKRPEEKLDASETITVEKVLKNLLTPQKTTESFTTVPPAKN